MNHVVKTVISKHKLFTIPLYMCIVTIRIIG